MDWLSKRAVVRASCVWRSKDGEPWLVSFDFAEIEGRLECVGTQMRSYLQDEAQDALGSYTCYTLDTVSREDLLPQRPNLPALKLTDPDSRAAYLQAIEDWELAPPHRVLHDGDALDALLHDPEHSWQPKASPRVLRATMLRELPLGELLARVRQRVAADWRSGLIAPRSLVSSAARELTEQPAPPPELRADQLELVRQREQLEKQTWELLKAVRKQGGYDDELIRRRDELSSKFAELDAKGNPEAERRRELWRRIEEIDGQLKELSERSLAGGNYGPQFAELITRRTELEFKLEGIDYLDEVPAPEPTVPLDAEQFIKLTQEAASSFALPGQKAGRPSHYSLAQLELVAKTYREAYRSGSSSPTKEVAAKLEITRGRAAKLVMRCRDPRVGLLAPTEKRKAGEIVPGSDKPDTEPSEP